MKQAAYHSENEGHFGLAFDDYTHFTSPIRRYSDLLVHREIKQILSGKKPKIKNINQITQHISMTERRADEASRDVEKWLKCEYMQSKIGQEFSGVISGVASFGIFVELGGTFIDGLVAMRDLTDDYYIYDEASVSLKGRASGKVYKLGDKIDVLLASVNLEERQIGLVLVE
jgi:ribonuclease R